MMASAHKVAASTKERTMRQEISPKLAECKQQARRHRKHVCPAPRGFRHRALRRGVERLRLTHGPGENLVASGVWPCTPFPPPAPPLPEPVKSVCSGRRIARDVAG